MAATEIGRTRTLSTFGPGFGNTILKDSALKPTKPRVPLFREDTPCTLVMHVGTMLAMTMLWSGLAGAAPQTTLRFSNQLASINAGQPPHVLMRDASGADNLLRSNPPSSANRESCRKIAAALKADGARFDAQLIDAALSKGSAPSVGTPAAQEGMREGVGPVRVARSPTLMFRYSLAGTDPAMNQP